MKPPSTQKITPGVEQANPAKTDSLPVLKIVGERVEAFEDTLISEAPLTVFLNGEELVTILCTPEFLIELAVGYLYAEGFIEKKEDIVSVESDGNKQSVAVRTSRSFDIKELYEKRKRLITPGCINAADFTRDPSPSGAESGTVTGADSGAATGTDTRRLQGGPGLTAIDTGIGIRVSDIQTALREVSQRSRLYQETGGVHNAALCRERDVLFFSEDIGRHNTLDKVIGHALLTGIPLGDKAVITSGRISSPVVLKMVKARIPVLISRSAPTSEAARLAEAFGVTLVGFARGKRFNVYSNAWRIERG